MSGLVDDPETLKAAGRMRALGVEPFLIRPGTTDDRPFVFSTTLRGLLDATPHTAAPDTYHSGQLMLVPPTTCHAAAPLGGVTTMY